MATQDPLLEVVVVSAVDRTSQAQTFVSQKELSIPFVSVQSVDTEHAWHRIGK